MWTLDELVERVREALAAEYSGSTSGRVRDVPDRRAIRWYTTIGLVDRPLGVRGRSALYGPRHLQQLVAIKRQQSEGKSLAQIQAAFVDLSPAELDELSLVPAGLLSVTESPAPEPSLTKHRPQFWAEHPGPPVAADLHSVALIGGVVLNLTRPVTDAERRDIDAAAVPLLELLASRGLLPYQHNILGTAAIPATPPEDSDPPTTSRPAGR